MALLATAKETVPAVRSLKTFRHPGPGKKGAEVEAPGRGKTGDG